LLAAVDKYGQVVSTNKGKLINAKLVEDASTAKVAKEFETTPIDQNFFSAYGVFNISGLLL
jgi:hypothetical protein